MAAFRAGWVAGALAWVGAAGAAQTEPASAAARAIDEHLARSVAFGFSGAALVVEKGVPVLARGYGVADRANGTACAPDTLFDICQLAQPFTACAVLVLEEQKKLKTRDTLDAFLPDVPADKRKIQLQHLLTHTSGLPWRIPGVGPKLVERDELLRTVLRVPLLDTPGADCVPSDTGYALLAAIVELVTKEPFEQALRELVLAPAGLTSTGFRQDGVLPAARAARAFLRPAEPLPDGARVARLPADEELAEEHELATEGWYSWALRGSGGMLSTVEDLWRFEQALRGTALLGKDAKKKLYAPALDDMACGWTVRKAERKGLIFERSGWTRSGFALECASSPGDDAYIVLLANVPGVLRTLAADVRALAAGKTVAPPPATTPRPEAELAALAGEYEAAGGARWRVAVDAGALLLEARTPAAFALQAGKLNGDQKHLLALAEELVAGLRRADFARWHELDREYERMRGVESWWRELQTPHGALRDATVLGLRPDADELDHVVVLLTFERGEEQLDLACANDEVQWLDTGPPYASRLRLVPDSPQSLVSYDLVRRQRVASARATEDGLELELPGGKAALRRR